MSEVGWIVSVLHRCDDFDWTRAQCVRNPIEYDNTYKCIYVDKRRMSDCIACMFLKLVAPEHLCHEIDADLLTHLPSTQHPPSLPQVNRLRAANKAPQLPDCALHPAIPVAKSIWPGCVPDIAI